MSLLRDSKYVKTIASQSQFRALTEDACRFVQSDTELLLRLIIKQAGKYMSKFQNRSLKVYHIDMVLEEMNLDFLSQDFTKNKKEDRYKKKNDQNEFQLISNDIIIQEEMKNIIQKRFQKQRILQLTVNWLQVPNIKHFQPQSTNQNLEKNKKQEKVIKASNDVQIIQTDDMSRFLIKEKTPNFLNKEEQQFLDQLENLLEKYFQTIDEDYSNLDLGQYYFSKLISSINFITKQNSKQSLIIFNIIPLCLPYETPYQWNVKEKIDTWNHREFFIEQISLYGSLYGFNCRNITKNDFLIKFVYQFQ